MTPSTTAVAPTGLFLPNEAEGSLHDFERAGCLLRRPTPEGFWKAAAELEATPVDRRYGDLEGLRGSDIVLGFLGRSHIGDVLCTSGFAGKLARHHGCRVHSVRHRSTYKVFQGNPAIVAFYNNDRIHLGECAWGPGHMIQKFQRFFDLPVDVFPRPEIFISQEESAWAWRIRSMLPRNRPVALVCTNSVTDNRRARTDTLGWQDWIDLLARRYTVIQMAVTKLSVIEEAVRVHPSHRAAWHPDRIYDNCIVLENLDTRRFFAAFSIADFFMGPNSGGSHLAAAFDVPALVILNSAQYSDFPEFPDRINENRWRHESFLYPYHSFLLS